MLTDSEAFFSVLTFAKPECDVLQPSLLRGSGCNTLSHTGLANVNTWKRMCYPLIDIHKDIIQKYKNKKSEIIKDV